MMTIIIVVLAVLGVLVLWLILTYNRFIALRNRTKEAWSDIDVQLKRRYDLIPNVVNAVKGYASHEKELLEKVTLARTRAMAAQGPKEASEAENALSATLKTLFAVAENYPDLKASGNFLDLQRELADTENKIQAARRFYNGNVRDMNTKIESFPANVVASMFGFKKADFFELEEEAAKKAPEVKF